MTLVKGSKKKRVKVIEYRARMIFGVTFAALALFSLCVLGVYFFGFKTGMAGQEQALGDAGKYKSELAEWRSKALEFEQLLENSVTAAQVDRQASEGVRQEVIELKDEIARLSEENSFYRGIMSPTDSASGLTIGSVELVRNRDTDSYTYKVVVQQLATRHNVLSGELRFSILGRQDGVETRYPLMMVSDTIDAERIKLRFKYFQVIEGELALPLGFEPEGVEIEAETSGSKKQKVAKKFGWLVEEV